MKKRIFVAINLPEKIKKRLKEYREKYNYLPVRWTKGNSLHLTLVFIGYVTDEQMIKACLAVREAATRAEPFLIDFKKIVLGPPGKSPRMIWAEGEANQELANLKNQVEEALLESESGFLREGNRLLKPHITLARIKFDKWHQIESRPAVEEEFKASVPVASIEVMESDLKRNGAEYMVLESCPLGVE